MKRKIWPGQRWTIGKKTIALVKKESNIDVSNEVYINGHVTYCGLILVQDVVSGARFDIDYRSLGKKLAD